MELSELGDGGSFSNIIAPCTLDEVMEMVFLLGSLQRHPFLQVPYCYYMLKGIPYMCCLSFIRQC